MTTVSIYNDKVSSAPLLFQNSVGVTVAAPSGDTLTASSGSASLGAAIGGTTSAPLLVLTPMVQAGTGYVVTVSDTKGLPAATFTFNITSDPATPTQIALNTLTMTTVSQAIPAAPGP